MLDRTSIPAPLSRTAGDSLRQALLAGPTSGLIRLTAILVVISALTCVYLWQASQVAALNSQIAALRSQTTRVEREYSWLVVDLAQRCSPAYIEQKAKEMGLVWSGLPTQVSVPTAADKASLTRASSSTSGGLSQRLRSLLPSLVPATFGVQSSVASWPGR